MEIDGPEAATYTNGLFTIENSTFVSKTSNGTVDLKSKAQGTLSNCKFVGLASFKLSASYDVDCITPKTDAYDRFVAASPLLIVEDNNAGTATMNVYTASVDGASVTCPLTAGYQTTVDGIYGAANNTSSAAGASTSAFDAWSWTAIKNKF